MAENGPPAADEKEMRRKLQELLLRGTPDPNQPKDSYAFWNTQPVVQFGEQGGQDGTIEKPKAVSEVRQDPYALPGAFTWSDVDVSEAAQLDEVHALLRDHYVEDSEEMFRFAYSSDFLRWALEAPGFLRTWHVGVRVKASGKLVAFISAIPAALRCDAITHPLVEINFLCVHKRLRSKRLAPVLIREITRRVHLQDRWHAVYTAGVVLPRPVAEAQYWHRSLNPRKLVAVGFSRLAPRMTMARTIKHYRLPEEYRTPGVRPMVPGDVPQVARLLADHLSNFRLAPIMSEEEVAHWLLPREGVVSAFVVEKDAERDPAGPAEGRGPAATAPGPSTSAPLPADSEAAGPKGGKKIVALFSFYTLPSTVIGHDTYSSLGAAYQSYTVPGPIPLYDIMQDALIAAHKSGHDVFNALDIFQNSEALESLKFGIGDGKLRYYLYNWRVTPQVQPKDVGLVML